ncbi:MMPL family transporter [Streptomyces longispororuber]|uniref:MMPL family transporter n=1 Tax=Streptomyces longispororuber TaxID=68230 RepID=UPI0036FA886C
MPRRSPSPPDGRGPRRDAPAAALRWCLRRARLVLAGAALVTLLAGAVGATGLDRLTHGGLVPSGSAFARDNAVLGGRYAASAPDLVLLVRTDAAGGVDDSSVARRARAVERGLGRFPGVVHTSSYWRTADPALRSRDGRAALIVVDLGEDEGRAWRAADTLVPEVTGRHGNLTVTAGGPAWSAVEAMRESRRDLLRAELIAMPLAALVLLFVFRSLVAAVVPLLTGAVAVAGTLAALSLLAHVTEVSAYAANITSALGFGLAVDYALFLVTRFREERAAGLAVADAVTRAVATAGRTVLVSAAVVALSLCSLFLFPLGLLRSLAWAGITVVLLSAAATVVVVPALLVVLAPHLDRFDVFARLRVRRGGADRTATEGLWWRWVARTVCRRPALWLTVCVGLLGLCVLPAAHAAFGISDARVLPPHSEPHAVARSAAQDFPRPPARQVLIGLPPSTPAAALDRYARRVAALPGAAEVRTVTGTYRGRAHTPLRPQHGRRFATPGGPLLTVDSRHAPHTAPAARLVRAVRALPAPGGHAPVTGEAVRTVDTGNALVGALPGACALTAAVTFVLLALFTRSLLIPLKAVAVAGLSLTACMGCLVHVFQDGHLRGLVGDFTVTGHLDGAIVVFVLVVAYALSIDYETFLLSRVCEAYTVLGDTAEAVTAGLWRTGRLVTGASLAVAAAMGALATSQVTPLKVAGVGLALATVVDATLVRGVLVPALMTLAGRANWWLPGPLAAFALRPAPPEAHRAATPAGLPGLRDPADPPSSRIPPPPP